MNKGMRLLEPPGHSSRPILDRVKESLFNILATYGQPTNKLVADLFCGVGSLGLEALSRGASSVTFVESDPQVLAVLKENLKRSGMEERARIIHADAFELDLVCQRGLGGYDLVFIDPPYAATADTSPTSRLCRLIHALSGQIAQDALVVVRTQRSSSLHEQYGELLVIDRREYGKMALTFLAKNRPSVVRVYRMADG